MNYFSSKSYGGGIDLKYFLEYINIQYENYWQLSSDLIK